MLRPISAKRWWAEAILVLQTLELLFVIHPMAAKHLVESIGIPLDGG